MNLLSRQIVLSIPWGFVISWLALFFLGVFNLYSASGFRLEEGNIVNVYYQKQLLSGLIGLGGFFLFMLFDYRHMKNITWLFFLITVGLLISIFFFGVTIKGARRWLDIGFANLQPSEIAKISILFISAHLLSQERAPLGWLELIKILAIGCLPIVLIILQPDLGTGLSLLLILGGVILYNGIEKKVFKKLLILLPASLPFGWFMLHDYQKQRIETFLNPGSDPQGAGYHIIQSQIAIGSGQIWGKGFLAGTQSQLRFLPEKHTDFALAVFGEEWGFMGCIFLLFLFCTFLYQIYIIAHDAKDRFGSFLAAGVFFYFFWQILINMGMVLGLLPVVGMPLPFISYGGSATVVNFCLVGLVMNVSIRRFVFKRS